jgi:hypothetical protein
VPFARGTLPTEFGGGRTPSSFSDLIAAPPLPAGQKPSATP